jgi:lipopolysaccharide assembly outer membrane protein LptD (OstA)
MRAILFALGVAGVIALGPRPTRAQQEHEDPALPPGMTGLEAGDMLRWQEGEEQVLFLSGGVKIRQGPVSITASRAMVWLRKGPAGALQIQELYAEGNVKFKRAKDTLWAERLLYNLPEDKAVMVEFRAKSFTKSINQSFYIEARQARMVSKGMVEADDLSLSTCSYGVPHYHLVIKHGTFMGVDEVQKTSDLDIWPFDSWQLLAESLYPELVGAPFFFFPALLLSPWIEDFPLRRLQFGRTTRFGYYAYATFGHRIMLPDENGVYRPWGDLELEFDWRQLRGGAYSANLAYGQPGYSGYVKTYFMWDLGRDPSLSFNATLPPLTRPERGRAHWFHRQDIDEHWRLELEVNYVSDSSLLEEFFDEEFRQDKEPETAAYLRYLDGPFGAYLYEKYRLNSWQTQLEYLPKINFTLLDLPVWTGRASTLYFNQKVDITRLRERFASGTELPTQQTWRMDSVTEVSMPWDFGVFQASPFVQEELTYYSNPLVGDSLVRELTTAGGRLTTQIHGTFPDLRWDSVGLRGVRHVAEVEVKYANTFRDTVPVSDLYPYDEVDQLTEFEQVSLSLRQRFLTRDGSGKVYEFFNVLGMIQYYPLPDRDTVTSNPTNYEPPFNWIPIAPDLDGFFVPRRWSNFYYEANFTPRQFLTISVNGQLNPDSGHEEIRNVAASVTPLAGLTVSAGESKVRGIVDAVSLGIGWQVTEKWSVGAATQYDRVAQQWLNQSIVIGRDFHDFIVQVDIENNLSTAEKRVSVGIVPKFLNASGFKRSPLLPLAAPSSD